MNRHRIIVLLLMLFVQTIAAAEGETSARLAESPLSAANLSTTAMGLLIVLGVMLGLAWVVRRFVQLPGIGKGAVRVLGGVSLGARERAVLLSVGKRRLLIGVAPGQVRTLADLGVDAEEDEALPEEPPSVHPFAQQLGRLIGQGSTPVKGDRQ
jgi:flagellar protein FliO/FliZ